MDQGHAYYYVRQCYKAACMIYDDTVFGFCKLSELMYLYNEMRRTKCSGGLKPLRHAASRTPPGMSMSLDDGCFQRCLVSDAVILKPDRVGKNVAAVLLEKLRATYEGVCSRHGYILPGSVELHHASAGVLQAAHLNGDVRYEVQYNGKVCNPALGSVLSARVVNMTRFGLLLHSGVSPGGGAAVGPLSAVVEIVVPRHSSLAAKATEEAATSTATVPVPAPVRDLDAVRIGDVVSVRIVGKKFGLNDRHISAVGLIVERPKDQRSAGVPVIGDNNDEDAAVIAAGKLSEDERVDGEESVDADTDDDDESIVEKAASDDDDNGSATDATDSDDDASSGVKKKVASTPPAPLKRVNKAKKVVVADDDLPADGDGDGDDDDTADEDGGEDDDDDDEDDDDEDDEPDDDAPDGASDVRSSRGNSDDDDA